MPRDRSTNRLDTRFLIEGLRGLLQKNVGKAVDLRQFVTAFDEHRARGLTLQGAALASLIEANHRLHERLALLEERSTSYRGIFEDGLTYAKHDLVTRSGALWLAQRQTNELPGSSNDWKLIVKRGRA